jgi:hypothetical protein
MRDDCRIEDRKNIMFLVSFFSSDASALRCKVDDDVGDHDDRGSSRLGNENEGSDTDGSVKIK